MEEQEIKMKNVPSNNSFEIIDETPKTDTNTKKFSSYDILPSNNDNDEDIPILDEDCTESLKVPNNSPQVTFTESYQTKIVQIQNMIADLKKNNMRKEIKCLERHCEKLIDSEKKNLPFLEFKNKMLETAKNDKNMSSILKKMYQK